MVSLLISDVDGTLLNGCSALTPRAIRAVKALGEAGIAFAIASGRPPLGMSMLVEPLNLQTPIAGLNGGVVTTPGLRLLTQKLLPPTVAHRIHGIIQSHGLETWINTSSQWFLRDPSTTHALHEAEITKLAPVVMRDLTPALNSAVKITSVEDDPERLAACNKDLADALGDTVALVRSQSYYLDATQFDANKGAALTEIAARLSIPPHEIATIGDMPNDVLMFRRSGLSIAMGNASASVQSQADYVTATNRDEGFAIAVETYVLSGGT